MAPQKTAIFKAVPADLMTARHRRFTPTRESLVVLPVRKVQAPFPSMITVGRTANNDIVVPDVSVSKFHAFFRTADGTLTLADAGSKNGTQVRGEPLAAKGAGVAVQPGDSVKLGEVELTLVDADRCWELIRSHDRRLTARKR